MHNIDKLIYAATKPDWRDVKFWHTHDDRLLSVNELTSPHMINICRQIVNVACREAGLDQIPVRNPLARVDFDRYTPFEWVTLCRLLLREVDLRIQQGYVPTMGYMAILSTVRGRIAELSRTTAPEGYNGAQGGQLGG